MSDRVMQFRVGVVVLATAIIAGILIVLFGDLPSLVQATYPVRMSFVDARGIAPGTPVRKNGILVGRVSSVMLDERGGVRVTADVDSYVPVYRDEQPRIATTLLHALATEEKRLGLATMCIGLGQGIAVLFERCE